MDRLLRCLSFADLFSRPRERRAHGKNGARPRQNRPGEFEPQRLATCFLPWRRGHRSPPRPAGRTRDRERHNTKHDTRTSPAKPQFPYRLVCLGGGRPCRGHRCKRGQHYSSASDRGRRSHHRQSRTKNIYLVRGEETAPLPESLEPDLLDRKKAEKLLASASIEGKERLLGRHPVTGETITLRKGVYGPYVELLQGSDTPKRASLFKHMRFTTVTLEDALCVLSLPRLIGTVEGEKIIGKNGRYGPYLVKGKETRDLLQEAQLLTISLEEAVALFVAPKPRRPRRRKSKPTFISKSDLGVSHIVRKGQRKKRPHQK